jgi:hypothetical protein
VISAVLMLIGLVFLFGPHLAGDFIGLNDKVDAKGITLGVVGTVFMGIAFC